MDGSADIAEGVEGASQLDGEELVAEVLLGDGLGCDEAVDAAIEGVPRTSGRGGEPLATMGRLKCEASRDFGPQCVEAAPGHCRNGERWA